ncbi:MAG: 4,5-DOPA dioxygenase extradiol [Myxococcota bacterium]|nr:4,5-DOPA dioxygenase extradiol [Myxococcota bacterium]
MPVLFVGHGSPMNAVLDNRWSRALRALGARLPRPRAVLAISAHWWIDGTHLTADVAPRTIHDFYGFPPELYAIRYPAPGSSDLVARVRALLGERHAVPSHDWGLDHGTWTVLRWLWPTAEVPVVQLSMDRRLSPQSAVEIGRRLAPLRDEGVIVLGSGNVTHNLRHAVSNLGRDDAPTPVWASRFDEEVARMCAQRDALALARLWPDGADARLAHPTPDHYLPLLYAAGAAGSDGGDASFPVEGFDAGSLSMRAVLWS